MTRAYLALGGKATSPGFDTFGKILGPNTLIRFYFFCVEVVGKGFVKQFNRGDAD